MKKTRTTVVVVTGLMAFLLAGTAPAQDDAQYVGAQKCAKTCHSKEKVGAQLQKWLDGPHSKAFATLATDEAKKVAAEKGIADPQKADECLSCHVTGHGKPAEHFAETFDATEGVGCESCHGPGSKYKSLKIMKDPEQAKAAGLITPTEETCTSCHNEKSPTFKAFDYAKRLAQIAHPTPESAE